MSPPETKSSDTCLNDGMDVGGRLEQFGGLSMKQGELLVDKDLIECTKNGVSEKLDERVESSCMFVQIEDSEVSKDLEKVDNGVFTCGTVDGVQEPSDGRVELSAVDENVEASSVDGQEPVLKILDESGDQLLLLNKCFLDRSPGHGSNLNSDNLSSSSAPHSQCRQSSEIIPSEMLVGDCVDDVHEFVEDTVASNDCDVGDFVDQGISSDILRHVLEAREIFDKVVQTDQYNFQKARVRVPSGLNIPAWESYLKDYDDREIVDYLKFGWPISFNRSHPLVATQKPHPSGRDHPVSVNHYIKTELGHEALLGPFDGIPIHKLHISPLMSRPKKDSEMRRIVLDLSWPQGFSVNDGIDSKYYLDYEYKVKLPTIDLMEKKILDLGRGAYLYKTDLSRGYRQLRVDPYDWPLLGFWYEDKFYIDICPPFGLRSAAMMMQRTSQAVSYIHALKGYQSFPYIDDFGGGETNYHRSNNALRTLQQILHDLGLAEAIKKVCEPNQKMIWLGILFNTVDMTMSIPKEKLDSILDDIKVWDGRTHATRKEIQGILGALQFVAKVSPPVRLFINRMLECLKETPISGSHTLSWGFKQDIKFFLTLLPHINGVKIIDKSLVVAKENIELDACLSGCGAWCEAEFYGRTFPEDIIKQNHPIAHLELLNLVVAVKLWARWWSGSKINIRCDNMNTCIVVAEGKSQDPFMQKCARELYLVVASYDIELNVVHTPGLEIKIADALSREHTDIKFARLVKEDSHLKVAKRVNPSDALFQLKNDI